MPQTRPNIPPRGHSKHELDALTPRAKARGPPRYLLPIGLGVGNGVGDNTTGIVHDSPLGSSTTVKTRFYNAALPLSYIQQRLDGRDRTGACISE